MSVSKKGFSMLEILASLILISALMLISINNTGNINLDHYYFMNDYVETQSKAILEKKDFALSHGVRFNSMGRVNQARTIDFKNHKVIVHLGSGYAMCE